MERNAMNTSNEASYTESGHAVENSAGTTTLQEITDSERRFLITLSKLRNQQSLTNRGWKLPIVECLYAKGLVFYSVNSGVVRLNDRGAVIVRQLDQQGWSENDAVLTLQEERYLLTFLSNKRGVRKFHNNRYALGRVSLRKNEWAIVERLEGLGYVRVNRSRTTITVLPKGRAYARELQQRLEVRGLLHKGATQDAPPSGSEDSGCNSASISTELIKELQSRRETRQSIKTALRTEQKQLPKTLYELGLGIAIESGTLCNQLQVHANVKETETGQKTRREITVVIAAIITQLEGICEIVGIDLARSLECRNNQKNELSTELIEGEYNTTLPCTGEQPSND